MQCKVSPTPPNDAHKVFRQSSAIFYKKNTAQQDYKCQEHLAMLDLGTVQIVEYRH